MTYAENEGRTQNSNNVRWSVGRHPPAEEKLRYGGDTSVFSFSGSRLEFAPLAEWQCFSVQPPVITWLEAFLHPRGPGTGSGEAEMGEGSKWSDPIAFPCSLLPRSHTENTKVNLSLL